MCTNCYWITDINVELNFVLFVSINKKEIKTKEKLKEEKNQNNFKKSA